jgi:hypothetical protein
VQEVQARLTPVGASGLTLVGAIGLRLSRLAVRRNCQVLPIDDAAVVPTDASLNRPATA